MSEAEKTAAAATDEEPRTPAWLPALGAALFLAVGVAWALWPSSARTAPVEVPSNAPKVVAVGGSSGAGPSISVPFRPTGPAPAGASAGPARPGPPSRP
jgi:hypothetical protein